jgi:DNA-binding MltR family transcriptional regulator
MDTDNYFKPLNELHDRLKDLDERGLVLTLAAFAEDSLAELLIAYMFDNSATKKLVSGYDSPLGTLSARIRACYSLGLITKSQFHDLEHLRAIRNKFSHTWKPISFLDPEIETHIKALHFNNLIDKYPELLREKIEGSISVLLLEIKVVINQVSKKRKNSIVLGNRIFAGLNGTTEEQIMHCREKLASINSEIEKSKSDKKEFFYHMKRIWIEKYHRVITMEGEDKLKERNIGLLDYAKPEEIKFSTIYTYDR